ncbi:MAG TPA: hypothetical protein VFX28_16525 [Methylomirabilota bacterium]|nr:hypothetical protein [Methylomirabilota bacterium]
MSAFAVLGAASPRHWRSRGARLRLAVAGGAAVRSRQAGGETLAMVVGGIVTGTIIGFFWHPAASLAAMLAAAAVAAKTR